MVAASWGSSRSINVGGTLYSAIFLLGLPDEVSSSVGERSTRRVDEVADDSA